MQFEIEIGKTCEEDVFVSGCVGVGGGGIMIHAEINKSHIDISFRGVTIFHVTLTCSQ